MFRLTLWPTAFLLTTVLTVLPRTGMAQTEDSDGSGERDTLPLWEIGLGGGGIFGPDYPGSSEHHARGLALPFVIYRGETFRIGDGQAMRAIAVENSRYEIEFSFDAAFDARSEENELRQGMDDLDFLFEIGPQLLLKLGRFDFSNDSNGDLDLAFQPRSVFSTDLSSIRHRGYILETSLRYRQRFLDSKMEAGISLSPLWASRKLHHYFYSVADEFATPERPAYEADSGYMGTELRLFADYDLNERTRVFAGLQFNLHNGSANQESPLLERNFNAGISAGILWTFFQSERRAPAQRNRSGDSMAE